MQQTSMVPLFIFKDKRRKISEKICKIGNGNSITLEILKHAKILISREKLSKAMRIYLLTSVVQILMILWKYQILLFEDNYKQVSMVPNVSKIFQ